MGNARIDKAHAIGYSDAEIARRIGVTRSYLCHVGAGRRELSPECEALLAELVGDDARMALAESVVNRAREPMRTRLHNTLFQTRERGAACIGYLVALAVAVVTTMCSSSTRARAV